MTNTAADTTNTSEAVALTTTDSQDTSETTVEKPAETVDGNIVSNGGHVNVEGQNATVSADGQSVTYSYIVSYQEMTTSNKDDSVSDLAIRIPKITNANVAFTLIGTRDENGNPISVNVTMTQISYEDAASSDVDFYGNAVDIPSAEALSNGATPYVVTGNDVTIDSESFVNTYNLYTNTTGSHAVKIDVTISLEDAKKIKYLAIDARMDWHGNAEGYIRGFETGDHSLEDFPLHAVTTTTGDFSGLANPSLISEDNVQNGHLVKSVSNPNTYITPNNGDWTWIPNDTNIDSSTFFSYADTFRVRDNTDIIYYLSLTEDMADQDVSAFYTGNVLVDYVIKGTNTSIKSTYTDTSVSPLVDLNGQAVAYNTAENDTEKPVFITVNGILYQLVGLASNSDSETGYLVEGTTHVIYEYVPVKTPQPDTKPSSKQEVYHPTNPSIQKVTQAIVSQKQASSNYKAQLPQTGESQKDKTFSVLGLMTMITGLFVFPRKSQKIMNN